MKKLAVFLALSTAVLMASCARPAASSAPTAKIQASSVAISSSSSTASTGPAISVATSTSGDATTLISYQIVFKIQNLSSQSINGFVIRATSLGDCAVEDQNPNSLPFDKNYAGYQWDCSSVIQPNATEQVSIMVIPKQARTQDIAFSFFDKVGKSALVDKEGNPVATAAKFNVSNGSGALNSSSSSSTTSKPASSAEPDTDAKLFFDGDLSNGTISMTGPYTLNQSFNLRFSYGGATGKIAGIQIEFPASSDPCFTPNKVAYSIQSDKPNPDTNLLPPAKALSDCSFKRVGSQYVYTFPYALVQDVDEYITITLNQTKIPSDNTMNGIPNGSIPIAVYALNNHAKLMDINLSPDM